jgi:hypothetical protein
VVEDIAVEGNDELPRPLRDLSWHDDLWGPFKQFAIALLVCYGLVWVADYLPPIAGIAMTFAVLIVGTILFPAVFLTTTTSGSIVNLTPDRVLRVIRQIGAAYVLCVLFWCIALVSYAAGIVTAFLAIYKLFFIAGTLPWWMEIPMYIGYPLLVLGMFVMHGFCWYLALQYRKYHESFGWAFQRHIRTNPAPPPQFPPRARPTAATAGAAKPREPR